MRKQAPVFLVLLALLGWADAGAKTTNYLSGISELMVLNASNFSRFYENLPDYATASSLRLESSAAGNVSAPAKSARSKETYSYESAASASSEYYSDQARSPFTFNGSTGDIFADLSLLLGEDSTKSLLNKSRIISSKSFMPPGGQVVRPRSTTTARAKTAPGRTANEPPFFAPKARLLDDSPTTLDNLNVRMNQTNRLVPASSTWTRGNSTALMTNASTSSSSSSSSQQKTASDAPKGTIKIARNKKFSKPTVKSKTEPAAATSPAKTSSFSNSSLTRGLISFGSAESSFSSVHQFNRNLTSSPQEVSEILLENRKKYAKSLLTSEEKEQFELMASKEHAKKSPTSPPTATKNRNIYLAYNYLDNRPDISTQKTMPKTPEVASRSTNTAAAANTEQQPPSPSPTITSGRSQTEYKAYYVDFELVVSDFTDFDPKTGQVEFEAMFKYKWWNQEGEAEIGRESGVDEYELVAKRLLKTPTELDKQRSFYPAISFRDKGVEFLVKNQVHTFDNLQEYYVRSGGRSLRSLRGARRSSRMAFSNDNLLSAKLQFKDDLEVGGAVDEQIEEIRSDHVGISSLRPIAVEPAEATRPRRILRRYSCLEQNVTLKFGCRALTRHAASSLVSAKREFQATATSIFRSIMRPDEPDSVFSTYEVDSLDMSRFPFDIHQCPLEFDLIPKPIGVSSAPRSANSTTGRDEVPVYLFPSVLSDTSPNRIFYENHLIDLYSYHKLVQKSNNYSWISKEWMLKKMTVVHYNGSAPAQTALGPSSARQLSAPEATTRLYSEDVFAPRSSNGVPDENLVFYSDMEILGRLGKRGMLGGATWNKTSKSKRELNGNSSSGADYMDELTPARISLRFYIYRRREPQVYIFVLPLVLFTLITFLIFFLPTTNTSEKTLIAFLNFACLLGYNIYVFKLVIYTYEFMRIPLMLQYSNCLMVIQLGVLAYTCFVKSIYHYGFLIFNGGSFSNVAEDTYRQILYMFGAAEQQQPQHQMLQPFADYLALAQPAAASGRPVQLSQRGAHLANGNNHSNSDKIMLNATDENDTILYHGCEKMEPAVDPELASSGVITNKNSSSSCKSNTDNNNMAHERCLLINRSNESLKLSMPMIKLEDSESGAEALNGITTMTNNEEVNYVTYNNIVESTNSATGVCAAAFIPASMQSAQQQQQQKCLCSALESDADCLNNTTELGHLSIHSVGGVINSGAGTPGCKTDPERTITIRNDLLSSNYTIQQQKLSLPNFDGQKILEGHHQKKKDFRRLINGNWVLTRFCCGNGFGAGIAAEDKMCPSPLCEHVRSSLGSRKYAEHHNHHHHHQKQASSDNSSPGKQTYPSSCCVSTATTRQLLIPECDYSSHLCRLRDPQVDHRQQQERFKQLGFGNQINELNKSSFKAAPELSFVVKRQNSNGGVEKQLLAAAQQQPYMSIYGEKPVNISNLSGGHNNSNNSNNILLCPTNLTSRLADYASVEMSRLNANVQRLVRMEEVFLRDKMLRDEWKRKARFCDGICCLLVFVLLVTCSIFIFFILPTVRTASMMD